MSEIKEIFKEIYLSLDNEVLSDRENTFYELIFKRVMRHLSSCKCENNIKNQVLGEIMLIGKDVVDECLSMS